MVETNKPTTKKKPNDTNQRLIRSEQKLTHDDFYFVGIFINKQLVLVEDWRIEAENRRPIQGIGARAQR